MPDLNFHCPYPGARMPVMARNVVATSQPLAVQAGVAALRDGGNAVDAALAAAITLTVVEPTSNGIGGDAFCILWDGAALHGLNASGRSPMAASAADFDGLSEMPLRGWDSVTVPGCVSAWVALSARFGKLPFARLFDAAIGYARDGFLVSPITARAWAQAAEIFGGTAGCGGAGDGNNSDNANANANDTGKPDTTDRITTANDTGNSNHTGNIGNTGNTANPAPAAFPDFAPFLPGGEAPKPGQLFRFPAQADTLEAIARSNGEAFYRGELAEQIAAAAANAGAKLSRADLAAHRCDWVGTLAHRYGEVELHEIPPNGQGLAALLMLGIVEQHSITRFAVDSADFFHLQIEAMKLAFADAHRYIADPASLEFPAHRLLAPGYLKARAALIDMNRAGNPGYGVPGAGGTVYLAAADRDGAMVSFIQSNFHGFGSGIVIPGTGISLQNRAAGFSLKPGHPNRIAGGKRPFHTIIPGFVMGCGRPLMSFGVMGGPMQPQGHAQMVIRVCDYGQNPQSASDAPRWQVLADNQIALEPGVERGVADELRRRGHCVHADSDSGELDPAFAMGGAQLIYKTTDGYIAGSDHRKDGMAAGF